jgi:serine/threonine protein kinase/Tfp pilus assembly protein PilF
MALTRIDEVLSQALELPPAARASFLDRACSTDWALRREVEELLEVDSRYLEALELPAIEHLDRWDEERWLGAEVGPYRLERLLGRGGTSTVYLGRRGEGIGPEVAAVKLLRSGQDGAEFERRFAQEGALLARLRHPAIASLLGGGSLGKSPYLLIEFVEGRPIDLYCREEGLDLRARLGLFMEVCQAVDFAHRKLVVHRDLKPANILVEANGKPKLLDFGVSKLLDPNLGPQAGLTATGPRLLTPEYASPEQLTFRPTTVTSDVYSLGVVLFELLAGRRPFETAGGDSRELFRRTLAEPPPRPSVAAREGEERWWRLLAGDLDAIVAKALEKDPDQRYASARDLADDLGRHLRQLPIRARRSTRLYLAGKFLRRRYRELILLALVAGLLAARELERQELRRERDRAILMRDFLVNLLEEADPFDRAGPAVTLKAALERSVERLYWFSDVPFLRAAFLTTAGDVYVSLGDFDRAEQLLQEGLAIRRRELPGDSPEIAASLGSLGLLRREQGDPEEARKQLEAGLEILDRGGGAPDRLRFDLIENLGLAATDLGDFAKGETYLEDGLALARRLEPDSPLVAQALSNLGFCLFSASRPKEAAELFRQSIDLRSRLRGDNHAETAISLNNLAAASWAAGDFAAAEPAFEKVLEIWRGELGEHSLVGVVLSNLGAVRHRLGRLEEAEKTLREALELQLAVRERDHPEVLITLNNLGMLLLDRGQGGAAREVLRDAYERSRQRLGAEHPATLSAAANLAEAEGKGAPPAGPAP